MMNHKKKAVIIAMIIGVFTSLIAVTASFYIGNRTYQVTVILKSEQASEFWGEVIAGIERASVDKDLEFTFVSALDENDAVGQMTIIDEVVAAEPDGIILAATDYYKLQLATKKIKDAGIKLVLIDSGVRGGYYDSIVSTDNYLAGYEGASQLIGYLQDPKHIVLINHVQSSLAAMEREQGARDALKSEYGEITVEIFYCNDDPHAAYDYIARLARYGVEIDGIIGLNERSTVGAARYLDETGQSVEIPLVGFDSSVEEIQLLEKGVVKSLIIQQPFNMGYTAMSTLESVMIGKKVATSIDTGSRIISKDNMYDEENQVILFPFNQQ